MGFLGKIFRRHRQQEATTPIVDSTKEIQISVEGFKDRTLRESGEVVFNVYQKLRAGATSLEEVEKTVEASTGIKVSVTILETTSTAMKINVERL